MKTYKITFGGLEEAIEDLKQIAEDDCVDYSKEINFIESLKDGVEITTFEQYYNLLDKIYQVFDYVHIRQYNCGTYLELEL